MKTTNPELIVMLTYQDQTVKDAAEVFEACKDAKARYFGMKEEPLSLLELQRIFDRMKECGKKTCLEVVTYEEPESLAGAKIAVACGVDVLMGTMYCRSVHELCRENGIEYHPFVGRVTGRPSVLNGSLDEMVSEAKKCLALGVDGIDLLGYRYVGNAVELNRRFVELVPGKVCLAGSVNSYQRLREVREAGPASFTIGGAFFENRFSGTIREQIDKVCDFISG